MPIVRPVYIDVTSSSASVRRKTIIHMGGGDVDLATTNVGGKAVLSATLKSGVAAPPTRAVSAGQGLSGGGTLAADRSLSIASFTGFLSKDFNPPGRVYVKGTVTALVSYDVGGGGHIALSALRLPPRGDAALKTRLTVVYSDTSTSTISNGGDTALTLNSIGLGERLQGDVFADAAGMNDGKRIQKLILEVENTDAQNDKTVDLATFRVRGTCGPAGGGSVVTV